VTRTVNRIRKSALRKYGPKVKSYRPPPLLRMFSKYGSWCQLSASPNWYSITTPSFSAAVRSS
jgi:hypothetical protein